MEVIRLKLDASKTIRGIITQRDRAYRNVLAMNWWRALASLVDDNTKQFKRRNGTYFNNNWSAEDMDDKVKMQFGTGTGTPAFTDYALQQGQEDKYPTGAFNIDTQNGKITLQFNATPDNDASELGLWQDIYYDILYTRALASITGGELVKYYIDWLEPWLRAYPLIFYGKLFKENPPLVNMDGTQFNVRAVGDTTAGKLQLALVTDDVAWSPDLYQLPLQNLNAVHNPVFYIKDPYVVIELSGYVLPSASLTVYGLALWQQVFDTSSNKHNVLVAYWKFQNPITIPANEHKFFVVRIVAH